MRVLTAGADLLRARNAVAAVFALNGFAMAGWISRIPALRDELALRPAQLGLLLLAVSAGSMLALPSAGWVVTRLGPARTVRAGGVLAFAGVVVVGIGGGAVGSAAVTAVGLFTFGAGSGVWDVAMNVEGADVERRLGRTIMPRFHAAWSFGSVGGAGTGALAETFGISLQAHLTALGVAMLAGVFAAVSSFRPVEVPHAARRERRSPLAAWREPRTLLIGLLVLCAALTEGTATDWLAVALVDGYDTPRAVGAVGFAVFVAAMATTRLSGTWLLDRYGRVPVLRTGIGLAIVGVAAFVLGGSLPIAMLGALLWGLGAALGFPVGMSAAADEERHAAARVSVVASIGYTAFLAGPPLIGLLADRVGVLRSLLVIMATLVLSLSVTAAARPLKPVAPQAD
ncbi:MAG: MFS transporter [Jiangellaceae bacterium]